MRFEVSNGLTALHDVHVLFFRLGQILLSLFCPFWVPYLVKLMRPPLFRAILGIVCRVDVGTNVVIVLTGGGGERDGDDGSLYLRCVKGDCRL